MSIACYANNGSLYKNTETVYIPCNITAVQSGGHSACCAIGDLCLSNGLCMDPDMEAKGANQYWRNGCTDKTFQDSSCANVCRGKEDKNHYNTLTFYCKDPGNRYCCASQGTLDNAPRGSDFKCCNDGNLTFTDDAPLVIATARAQLPHVTTTSSSTMFSSSISSSKASSGSSELYATQPASSTPSSEPSSSLSYGATAGVSIGATLGVVSIAAIVLRVLFLHRRKKLYEKSTIFATDEKIQEPLPWVTYESAGIPVSELESTELPAEMYHANTSKKNILQ